MIIDHKYMAGKINSFAANLSSQASRFWKGIKSTIQALKFGYRWKIGSGAKVRFWEDTWFGTSPLSVQFWPIYSICNEQTKSVCEVWDENQLKLTFRRNFDDTLMEQWHQLVEIAGSVTLTDDTDALIWQLDNKGIYSTSSLYHVINFRGGGAASLYSSCLEA